MVLILIFTKINFYFDFSAIQPSSSHIAGHCKNVHYKGVSINYVFKEKYNIYANVLTRNYDEFYAESILVQSYSSHEYVYFLGIELKFLKNKNLDAGAGIGSGGFSFEREPFTTETAESLLLITGNYSGISIFPFFNIEFRVPSTNLTFCIKPSYLITIMPKNDGIPEYRKFMVLLSIGAIIKE